MADEEVRWEDLEPDPRIVAALDAADRRHGNRADLIQEGDSSEKNNWSNVFADRCALMVANALRAHRFTGPLTVLPDAEGANEPPTITYWDRGEEKSKKIDVLVGDLIAGLQVAVTLKGVGFRDQSSLGFMKNVTRVMYELENETRRLHEYRPQAVVVGMYFIPYGSVNDLKTARTPSGFADAVTYLRGMTGRTDPNRMDEWHRLDLAFVGLYVPGETEQFTVKSSSPHLRVPFTYRDPYPRGVVRYFDVRRNPPRRGRPRVVDTLSLEEVIDVIAVERSGPRAAEREWADPEPGSTTEPQLEDR